MDIVKTFEKEGIVWRANEPMRLHTSFKTGGPAEIFLLPDSAAKLAKAVEICRVENKKTVNRMDLMTMKAVCIWVL